MDLVQDRDGGPRRHDLKSVALCDDTENLKRLYFFFIFYMYENELLCVCLAKTREWTALAKFDLKIFDAVQVRLDR